MNNIRSELKEENTRALEVIKEQMELVDTRTNEALDDAEGKLNDVVTGVESLIQELSELQKDVSGLENSSLDDSLSDLENELNGILGSLNTVTTALY